MAILIHAVINTSSRLWKCMPEYSAEAAAPTVRINFTGAIVLGVAVVVVVLVYGPRNLSRRPRQVLAAASGESQPRVR